jgi:hypothetical protein
MARPRPIVVPGGLSQDKTFTDVNVDVGALVRLFDSIRNKNIEARQQQEFPEQFGSVFEQQVPAAGPQLPAGGIEDVGIAQEGAELAPPPTAAVVPEDVQALGKLFASTPQGRAEGRQFATQALKARISPEAKERKIIKDAAGFQRFVDTGKRVFPGAEAPDVEPKSIFGTIGDVSKYTPESVKKAEQSNLRSDLVVNKKVLEGSVSGKDKISAEKDLRKEFAALSKEFRVVRDSFERIKASAADPSAAGDLALIFNYMKVLDPGSTVREGEFATAQNAAGVPERIRAQYGQIVSGERLTDLTRKDFLDRAGKLFGTQDRIHKKRENTFKGIAKRSKLNPKNIVIDLNAPEFDEEADIGTGAVIETLPQGATQVGTSGGKRVFEIDGKTFIED